MSPEQRLAELAEELSRGRIVEARLKANDAHLDGLCDYGSGVIYIDPRTAIVSTLLHELIHRRWPSWPEARVAREERRLIRNMTTSQVQHWYRRYAAAKQTRRSTVRVDDGTV